MRARLFIALLCTSSLVHALNVNDPRRFECRQGSCLNGSGVAWDAALSVNMQGNWRNGNTIPGETYVVTLPIAPNKQFKQVYGQDGLLESGDMPRSLGVFNAVIPAFRGSYGRYTHAFLRQTVAVIRQGVYDTGLGIEYRGRFEYLAAKSGMTSGWGSGFYVFYGDRLDTEENEKESGLFISDETPGGARVRFVKADPSYLAVMQKKYQQDMEIAKGDFAQQESEQKWRSALAVIGKVAFSLAAANSDMGGNLMSGGGSGGGGLTGLTGLAGQIGGSEGGNLAGNIAMGLVSGMFNQGGGFNVKDLATQTIGSVAGGNQQLTNVLLTAVSEGLAEAGTPGTTMQARSTSNPATNGRVASTGSAAVDAFAGAVISNTTNTIASAITGSTNNASLGNLSGALLNQMFGGSKPALSNAAGNSGNPVSASPSPSGVAGTSGGNRAAPAGRSGGSTLSAATKAAAEACPRDYRGPDDDPQFDSYCKLAQFNQCLDKVTGTTTYQAQTQSVCNTLDRLLRSTKGGRAASYCSYCK
ncbi:MAG: hypothetical protein KJ852_13230 [Gammaproteobacteria bacterium]|nr:hypothetical protein [Gammaproteobacteria bacterium]MBU0787025.1 hypothetical protein [Gammaproteobacteria bacterium]MBU0816276.1 hypothetical protein [Gammaproteobacteria bacterium]MBU1787913.1 hypothetical protein [Gammaproteobacteria bacterium]